MLIGTKKKQKKTTTFVEASFFVVKYTVGYISGLK
jgi:hypothetical protein